MSSRMFDQTYDVLSKALDVSARRHTLIAGNISNMDTIGYKPNDLDFKDTLKAAIESETDDGELNRTNPKHLDDNNTFDIDNHVGISEYVHRFNLDSVNIDTEMTNLLENNIKFRTATEIMMRKMSLLKMSITEGGR